MHCNHRTYLCYNHKYTPFNPLHLIFPQLSPPTSGNHKSDLCFYDFGFLRFHKSVISYSICLSLSDLFLLALRPPTPSLLLQWQCFLLFYGWVISHYMCVYTHTRYYHVFFMCLSGDRHRLLPYLGNCNNAAINIGVHISFQISVFWGGMYTQE